MKTFQEWVILEKKGEKHSYSCVLAKFNQPEAQAVLNWSKKYIKDEDLYIGEDGGMGREDEIHVTALYGLHTNNAEPVEKILKNVKPFKLTLGKISKFNNPDFDVIKFEVESRELHRVNRMLKSLDFTSKFKDYVPHCTVAYVKKGTCDKLVGNTSLQGKIIFVNSLTFSPSEGNKKTISLT